jgi:hypothetical protein
VLESRPIAETSVLNRIGKGAVDITDPALSVRALGRSWRRVECGAVGFWGRPFLGNGKATITAPCCFPCGATWEWDASPGVGFVPVPEGVFLVGYEEP